MQTFFMGGLQREWDVKSSNDVSRNGAEWIGNVSSCTKPCYDRYIPPSSVHQQTPEITQSRHTCNFVLQHAIVQRSHADGVHAVNMQKARPTERDDSRVIAHFDYDCFYASVVENENPALKNVPLAIQQKQIIVTCNYEARKRGLYKLQLIADARKICPDVVIILGEDISRFRDASKDLYNFATRNIWSGRAERLGFDEVWLDITDMVDYNYDLLNHNDLQNSFFCLDQNDPTVGFHYDASNIYGPTFPKSGFETSIFAGVSEGCARTRLRLALGSHLARHLRHEVEQHKGYTSTVGIATNKILSKLIGCVNKPKNQTTLLPSTDDSEECDPTSVQFMDAHDIGKVPGIGFKLAQKLRARVLGREPSIDEGLVYGGTKEKVSVRDVRLYPTMGPELLEEILSGPGSQKGIGGKVWKLLHGVDDSEVGKKKKVPSQISQEDSYMKYLYTFGQVREQLALLAERLLARMQIDLMEDDDLDDKYHRRWMAHPKTIRLSTRPRPPRNADGSRSRTFHRISRSAPLPNFVFGLAETTTVLAEKLVAETLIPMFRKLHPQGGGWNLSLINIAVTNMAETAADSKDSEGRDIGRMFKRQDEVLKDFKITDFDMDVHADVDTDVHVDVNDESEPDLWKVNWESDEEKSDDNTPVCPICQAVVPGFARDAHQRYHFLSD